MADALRFEIYSAAIKVERGTFVCHVSGYLRHRQLLYRHLDLENNSAWEPISRFRAGRQFIPEPELINTLIGYPATINYF